MSFFTSGEFLVILSTFAFGSMGVLAKGLYNSGINVGTTLTFRFIIATISLYIYIKYKKISLKLTREEFIHCAILGVGGYSLFSFFYFFGVNYTGASITALIFSIFPVFVCILSKIFFNEKIGIKKIFFLALSIVALYLLTSLNDSVHYWGVVLSLLGALSYAIYIILIESEKTKNMNPIVTSFYIILFTAITNILFWSFSGQISFQVSKVNFIRLLTLGVFSTSVAILSFYIGVKKIGAVKASIISNLEALIAAILALIFLNETLDFTQIIGAALMIFSIVGVTLVKE